MQGTNNLSQPDFTAIQSTVSKSFALLYTIDISTLTPHQKKDHQEALAAAHLALIRSENTQFEALSQDARQALAGLHTAIGEIDTQLHTLQSTAKKLELLAKAAKVFQALAGVLV